jgi:hypothetical protein
LRGLYAWDGYLFAVARRGGTSPVWRINTNGAYTEIGEINTSNTGRVTFADNPTQLCIADGVTAWVYTPASGAVVEIADTDFAAYAGVGGVTYQDSYGIFYATGADGTKWFFSDTNDFTAYDATDVYTQRARNDDIAGIISHRQQIWIPGKKAYEVWYNYGGDNTSTANPTFALYKDGVYDVGIIAPATLTDMQGAAVCWLSNRNDLIMSSGLNPTAVTNGMFSRELSGYLSVEDANAFSYVDEGHTFVQINFPTADKTWCFDATTKMWFKKQSWKPDGTWGRHRANCYAYFQNKHYVGDYSNGKVYEMTRDTYDDDGNDIRRELYTVNQDSGIHPKRHNPVQVITASGVGLVGATAEPQIMLRYSNNDGNTWSSEIWRGVGDIGEYGNKAIWWRLGSSSKRMYHLAMTDRVLWRVKGVDAGEVK